VVATFRSLAALALLYSTSARAVSLRVGVPSASPGDTVTVEVALRDGESAVSSLSIDLGFPSAAPIDARPNGRPSCAAREEIDKPTSAFTFRPNGCAVGRDCTSIRAGITSFVPDTANLPIPDGVVFSCALTVPADAAIGERIRIDVLRASAIAPDSSETDVTEASESGFIDVVKRPSCAGDCDHDGRVGIGELARAVAIGLGLLDASECGGLDLDQRDGVTADEVIAAEVNAGSGCPSAARPR
jgi:hypothetical protein